MLALFFSSSDSRLSQVDIMMFIPVAGFNFCLFFTHFTKARVHYHSIQCHCTVGHVLTMAFRCPLPRSQDILMAFLKRACDYIPFNIGQFFLEEEKFIGLKTGRITA